MRWSFQFRRLQAGLVLVLLACSMLLGPAAPAAARTSPEWLRHFLYGDIHLPTRYTGSRAYQIMPQGEDSNCDYIAVANGVQNTGGDGAWAYRRAREFIPQSPREFKEGFYSVLGPNGSDLQATMDNIGTAPEAFVGFYEANGYNAVSMATPPGEPDLAFVKAIYERLAADPDKTFAALYIYSNNRDYGFRSRTVTVPETGERVEIPYLYHVVAGVVDPNLPNRIIILDGITRFPFAMTLEDLAYKIRGYNRVVVASRQTASLQAHQSFQLEQLGKPYVDTPLGGLYLRKAREVWGKAYGTWGKVIALPLKVSEGLTGTVALFGEYVQYEREGAGEPTLVPLGRQVAAELMREGLLKEEGLAQKQPLVAGQQSWVVDQFGSLEQFFTAFGQPLTGEFWLSTAQLQANVLHKQPHPLVDSSRKDGYVCTLTERGMLAWNGQTGFFLVPLGRAAYAVKQAQVLGAAGATAHN